MKRKEQLITGVTQGKLANEERHNEIIRSFEAKKLVITYKEWDEKRTVDQNSGLWRWNNIVAEEIGDTPASVHYDICGELYGWHISKTTGNPTPNKTTSGMSTSEFSHHIKLYEIKVRELFNINLPPFSYED